MGTPARDHRSDGARRAAGPPSGRAAPHPGGTAPLPGSADPHPGGTAPLPGSADPHPGGAAPLPGSAAPAGGAALPGGTTPDPVAVAALALGLLAVVPLAGVAAVVCGHLALRRASPAAHGRAMAGTAPGHTREGRALTVAGLVMGYAMTALWALVLVAVLLGQVG